MNFDVTKVTGTGAELPNKGTVQDSLIDLILKGLNKKVFDAVLMPLKVPSGDSYTYLVTDKEEVLGNADPIPPVMPVQGAHAISSLSRCGTPTMNVAAVMRPCEVRATIELSKLKQVDLSKMLLISMDCPGVVPLQSYTNDPKKWEDEFRSAQSSGDMSKMRQLCKVCSFSSAAFGDIHVASLGQGKGGLLLIAGTEKGKTALDSLGMTADKSLDGWKKKVEGVMSERGKEAEKLYSQLNETGLGIEGLVKYFGRCIGCHNCSEACPICYCQLCAFDAQNQSYEANTWESELKRKGGVRMPPNTINFHVGRMLHMAMSCVACGQCSDACPVHIPVANIFKMVGESVQQRFEYVPGQSQEEDIPLKRFELEEFTEVES